MTTAKKLTASAIADMRREIDEARDAFDEANADRARWLAANRDGCAKALDSAKLGMREAHARIDALTAERNSLNSDVADLRKAIVARRSRRPGAGEGATGGRCVARWGGPDGSRCKLDAGHTGGHSWECEACGCGSLDATPASGAPGAGETCKRCIGKGTRWDGRPGPCTRCNGSGIDPKPEEATSDRFRAWMERVAPDDERNMEWDDERPIAAPAVGERGRDA